jgi:hypothetical protein
VVKLGVGEPSIVDLDARVVDVRGTPVVFEVTFGNTGDRTAHDVRVVDAFEGAGYLQFGGAWTVVGLPPGAIDASTADTLDLRLPGPGGLVWSTYIGSTSSEFAISVAVDRHGAVTVGGMTADYWRFPTTSGAAQPRHGGGTWDNVVCRFDPPRNGDARAAGSIGGLATRCGVDFQRSLHHRIMVSPRFTMKPSKSGARTHSPSRLRTSRPPIALLSLYTMVSRLRSVCSPARSWPGCHGPS